MKNIKGDGDNRGTAVQFGVADRRSDGLFRCALHVDPMPSLQHRFSITKDKYSFPKTYCQAYSSFWEQLSH